jgi:hypothetical protein
VSAVIVGSLLKSVKGQYRKQFARDWAGSRTHSCYLAVTGPAGQMQSLWARLATLRGKAVNQHRDHPAA